MRQIRDYLQTQALNADAEAVALARAAAAAVMAAGRAHIERGVLLHEALPEHVAAQTEVLKSLFMALDSACSRQNVLSAALYGLLPEQGFLVRLAQYGRPIEAQWLMDAAAAQASLAARTAQSGWANVVADVAHWLDTGELSGQHNRLAAAQTSLPVCGEDGCVYGVLHIETAAALDEAQLADWIGLALAALPLLRGLLPQSRGEEGETAG